MKRLKVTWITIAVAAAVLALAGVALAATDAPRAAGTPAPGVNCGVTDDPQAIAELQDLRAEFWDARQAWFDEYGAERTTDEAQAAFQQLRDDHIAKVQAVFDEYGIDATAGQRAGAGHGPGAGGGMLGGGYGHGGMMGGGTAAVRRRLRGLRPQRRRRDHQLTHAAHSNWRTGRASSHGLARPVLFLGGVGESRAHCSRHGRGYAKLTRSSDAA